MAEDYCELCDLPLSQCVHGRPEPVAAPAPATPRATPVRRRRAPSSTGSGSVSGLGSGASTRTVVRRRTQPEEFRPWILAVLLDAGGEAEADDVMATMAEQYAERLRPGDHETGPQGELRWRTAARWARKSLADEGLLVAPRPGLWQLTDQGRQAARAAG